jgi:hypothetical protein
MPSDASKADPAAHPRRGEEPMYELIELFFFAYRDFVGASFTSSAGGRG